jgi:hypothetical protein
MGDKLEKFIENNRSDFDEAAPAGELWNRIEAGLGSKRKLRLFSLKEVYKWSAAAAVLCILLTSVYFLFIRKDSHEIPVVKNETTTPGRVNNDDISSIAPEYADEAKEAYRVIETRQQELKSAASGQPRLYEQFSADLKTLDSSYQVLKNQAVRAPGRQLIIRAMMQNLQLQAELLNRQLMIMNQFKNSKNQKDEKAI